MDKSIINFKTPDFDYIVYLNPMKNISWGNNKLIYEKNSDDGFNNTKDLYINNDIDFLRDIINSDVFGEKYIGYVPSFLEFQIIKNNFPDITFETSWTSTILDPNHIMDSDGNICKKEDVKSIFVFGRRIIA